MYFFLVSTTTTTVWYAAVSFMINYIHSYDLAICCNCILFTFFLFGLTRLFFCVHIGCDLIFFCFWLQVIKSASAIIHPVPPPLTVLTNTIGGFAQRDQLVSKTRDEGNTIRCDFISILDAIVWTSVCVYVTVCVVLNATHLRTAYSSSLLFCLFCGYFLLV